MKRRDNSIMFFRICVWGNTLDKLTALRSSDTNPKKYCGIFVLQTFIIKKIKQEDGYGKKYKAI